MTCIRHQYELLHYKTGAINAAMGDIYNQMALSVSNIEKYFCYGIAASSMLFYHKLG